MGGRAKSSPLNPLFLRFFFAGPGGVIRIAEALSRAMVSVIHESHQPPFSRPPIRPHACLRGLSSKANSWQLVAQNLVDLVAVISGGGKNGLSRVVTAENHEDVLVLLDELLPRLLAGVAFGLHSPGVSRHARVHIGTRIAGMIISISRPQYIAAQVRN